MTANKQEHWEQVYQTKTPEQVSWTQETPTVSLDLIKGLKLDKKAKIIDIGGGDSNLVDHLLEEGYKNISVLDISAAAISRAKKRLGTKADQVQWIVSDVLDFKPQEKFDLWHDRAAFHFLTETAQRKTYVATADKAVSSYMIMATFSELGPNKCSGLEIKQYSEASLRAELQAGFNVLNAQSEAHITPFDTTQNFLFCSFEKRKL